MASARLRGQSWTGYWRDGGKQKTQGGFATQKAALDHALLAEALAKPRAVEHPAQKRGRETVAGYAPKWLESQILEETTRETYRRTIQRIVRHLGGMAREQVTSDDVRKMLKALKKSGLADATVSATLDLARGMLGEQACAGVNFRIKDQRERLVASKAQAKAIEDAIDARYRLFVRTAFATGCRWGELIAIRGTDVEKRGTGYVLKVRRTITEVADKHSERNYGKSAKATRDISVPGLLALDLMAFGKNLCFTNTTGGYLRRSGFRANFWKSAVEKAGLPNLRVHDCRHSAISWWANGGIPLAAVRDRAGHSNISVTSRYIHVMPGDTDPFAAFLAEAA